VSIFHPRPKSVNRGSTNLDNFPQNGAQNFDVVIQKIRRRGDLDFLVHWRQSSDGLQKKQQNIDQKPTELGPKRVTFNGVPSTSFDVREGARSKRETPRKIKK
jgi:hypothetical protein